MARPAKNPNLPDLHNLTATVNEQVFERINALTAQRQMSRSGLLKIAIAEFLDRHSPEIEKTPEAA